MRAPVRGIKFSAKSPLRLASFYRDVLGWKATWEDLLVTSAGDPRPLGQYGVIDTGYPGDVFVSIQPSRYPELWGGVEHVGTTFAVMVEDLDAALRRAVEHGAKIKVPPVRPSARAGYLAEIEDPEGNSMMLWEPSPAWEPDEWAKRIGYQRK